MEKRWIQNNVIRKRIESYAFLSRKVSVGQPYHMVHMSLHREHMNCECLTLNKTHVSMLGTLCYGDVLH